MSLLRTWGFHSYAMLYLSSVVPQGGTKDGYALMRHAIL